MQKRAAIPEGMRRKTPLKRLIIKELGGGKIIPLPTTSASAVFLYTPYTLFTNLRKFITFSLSLQKIPPKSPPRALKTHRPAVEATVVGAEVWLQAYTRHSEVAHLRSAGRGVEPESPHVTASRCALGSSGWGFPSFASPRREDTDCGMWRYML